MKKWIFGIIGIIIVVVVVAIFVLLTNIGSIIKTAVNTYGPDITRTEVHLSDVNVSLLSARAEITGLSIGNPPDFRSPKAAEVGSVYLDVDEKSLMRDTIIIDRIEVVAPHITYEKRSGTDNFKTILGNIKQQTAHEKAAAKTEKAAGPGKKLIIRDFVVRDGKVTLAMATIGGREMTASLPDIHLTDIGQKDNGATPAEAARQIVAALYEKISGPAVTDALNNQLRKLETEVQKTGEEVQKRTKDLEGTLKGLLGK